MGIMSSHVKFPWKKAIKSCLKTADDNKLSMKKLKKKVQYLLSKKLDHFLNVTAMVLHFYFVRTRKLGWLFFNFSLIETSATLRVGSPFVFCYF